MRYQKDDEALVYRTDTRKLVDVVVLGDDEAPSSLHTQSHEHRVRSTSTNMLFVVSVEHLRAAEVMRDRAHEVADLKAQVMEKTRELSALVVQLELGERLLEQAEQEVCALADKDGM